MHDRYRELAKAAHAAGNADELLAITLAAISDLEWAQQKYDDVVRGVTA